MCMSQKKKKKILSKLEFIFTKYYKKTIKLK